MYSHPQHGLNQSDVAALRQMAGRWLKQLREEAGLSQRDLSNIMGFEYYTFVSQIESGRGRIPPDRYEAYAKALNVRPDRFVRELLRFYDPVTYDILFVRTY